MSKTQRVFKFKEKAVKPMAQQDVPLNFGFANLNSGAGDSMLKTTTRNWNDSVYSSKDDFDGVGSSTCRMIAPNSLGAFEHRTSNFFVKARRNTLNSF